MKKFIRVGIGSVTYAIEARELLSKYGINSGIVRLRQGESPRGCAFGLIIPMGVYQSAASLMTKAQINFIRLNS